MGVVHQAQQGFLKGEFGQQSERREAGEQPPADRTRGRTGRRTGDLGGVLTGDLGESERTLQGPALRPRQAGQPVESGGEQQAQPGERELRLVLDAGRPDHPEVRPGGRRRVLQQRGLADARLAPQHQRPAAAGPRPVQQAFDGGLFVFPPVQHDPTLPSATPVGPAAITDT